MKRHILEDQFTGINADKPISVYFTPEEMRLIDSFYNQSIYRSKSEFVRLQLLTMLNYQEQYGLIPELTLDKGATDTRDANSSTSRGRGASKVMNIRFNETELNKVLEALRQTDCRFVSRFIREQVLRWFAFRKRRGVRTLNLAELPAYVKELEGKAGT